MLFCWRESKYQELQTAENEGGRVKYSTVWAVRRPARCGVDADAEAEAGMGSVGRQVQEGGKSSSGRAACAELW